MMTLPAPPLRRRGGEVDTQEKELFHSSFNLDGIQKHIAHIVSGIVSPFSARGILSRRFTPFLLLPMHQQNANQNICFPFLRYSWNI